MKYHFVRKLFAKREISNLRLLVSYWFSLWTSQGLNLGPPDYESVALTNWATSPVLCVKAFSKCGCKDTKKSEKWRVKSEKFASAPQFLPFFCKSDPWSRYFRSRKHKKKWFFFCSLNCTLTLGQGRLHLGNKRKTSFFFVFRSVCTTFATDYG